MRLHFNNGIFQRRSKPKVQLTCSIKLKKVAHLKFLSLEGKHSNILLIHLVDNAKVM